jgi:molybdopterin-guanine dinucleotide biosynthesis protein A
MKGAVMREFDAIVLAGGRSRRLGGEPKALLRRGSERLLDRAIAAAAGARQVIVVGPAELPAPAGAVVCREDPPFAGPVAGLAAGIEHPARHSEWALVLACDIPGSAPAVAALLTAFDEQATDASPHFDALLAHPEGDRPQALVALYRVAALRAEFARRAPADRSVWSVLDQLSWASVPAPAGSCADIDTFEAADALGWRVDG